MYFMQVEYMFIDESFIKNIFLVAGRTASYNHDEIACERTKAMAAPVIPNFGINKKFKPMLEKAPISVRSRLSHCRFSARNHLLLVTPKNTNTEAQICMDNTFPASLYFSPNNRCIKIFDASVIGIAMQILIADIRSYNFCSRA